MGRRGNPYEDVMALLRDYHAAIGELVINYGTLVAGPGTAVEIQRGMRRMPS
jgi:hypothetical protein